MVFNALISNSDDHPRNHAIIAINRNWRLSPAYDLTPSTPVSKTHRELAMQCGDQRPQEFQVFVQKNRRPIRCGKVRVKFIARKDIDAVPVREFNTSRGQLRVSTPEGTAIDLTGYPEHVGGLDQVATILSELAYEIDASVLAKAAATAPITWIQRLGYILELVDAESIAAGLREYVDQHVREYTMLIPSSSNESGPRLRVWKLVVNAELDPDI